MAEVLAWQQQQQAKVGRETDRQTDIQVGRQTDGQAGRETCRQTRRQTGGQVGRQPDRRQVQCTRLLQKLCIAPSGSCSASGVLRQPVTARSGCAMHEAAEPVTIRTRFEVQCTRPLQKQCIAPRGSCSASGVLRQPVTVGLAAGAVREAAAEAVHSSLWQLQCVRGVAACHSSQQVHCA